MKDVHVLISQIKIDGAPGDGGGEIVTRKTYIYATGRNSSRRWEVRAGIAFLQRRQREMRNRERMERDTIWATAPAAVLLYDINDAEHYLDGRRKQILSRTKRW